MDSWELLRTKRVMGWGERACCGWHGSAPSREDTQLEPSPSEGKEWSMYPAFYLSQGLAEGIIPVHLTKDADREPEHFGCLMPTENKMGKLITKLENLKSY